MQLLELNDLNLSWYGGASHVQEPGAALVEDGSAVYGSKALARARVAPRGFQDQHWQFLNSDSLAVSAPGVQNNADLIYRHLQELAERTNPDTKPKGLICAVPGTVSNEQLGLLLGIANEAGIEISSFVHSASLYCLNIPLPSEAWCLDVQNRRGLLTRLLRDDAGLHVAETLELLQLGMNGLIDGWLHQLTDQFVARSRFDPLRVAETEQQLFDQVRAWLPLGGPLQAAVDHREHQRAVDLSFEEAAGRAQQRYREAQQKLPAQATVVLTPNASSLPGLSTYLSGHGHSVLKAEANDLWSNAQNCLELSNPEAVHFITSLATNTATTQAPAESQHATHALQNNIAVPLASLAKKLATLAGSKDLGFQVSAPSDGVTINGTQRTTQQSLSPGDRLSVGDQDYICIRVDHGPTA